MSDTPTFGRYAEIPVDKMTPEQKEGYAAMMESRGRLPGPNKIWIHNPRLAKVIGPFGAHFQPGKYSLSEREREIAVCVVTSHWRSAYPTSAHERIGKQVGLPAEKVDAILCGLPTKFDDEREQVVYEMAIALTNGRWVPRGLYERAVKALGHPDGPLQQRRDDARLLRRAGRRTGNGALKHLHDDKHLRALPAHRPDGAGHRRAPRDRPRHRPRAGRCRREACHPPCRHP
jgi:4-carboxymuconolactone decarboxylase